MALGRWVPTLLMSTPLATALQSGVSVQSSGINAVSKVVVMLEGMIATCKEEKASEEIAFAEYSSWCKSETASLSNDVQESAKKAEQLTATAEKLGAEIEELGISIVKLNSDIEGFEKDLEAQTAQRAKDHQEFAITERDLSESVDALERAIQTLSEGSQDREGSLLEVKQHPSLPAEAHAIVEAFLAESDGVTPPTAKAYEGHSDNVISLLKNLLDTFRNKLGAAQKDELDSVHAYEMVRQDLKDSIQAGKQDAIDKSKVKDQKITQKAEVTGQLQSTLETKATDSKTLSEVSADCEEKTLSYNEKQQLRKEELEALETATKILSGDDVTGAAKKHLSLAQPFAGLATSLLQQESSKSLRAGGLRHKVREFLAKEGERLQSKAISLLAQRLQADPFAKVKGMIDELITRLEAEAKQDAEHEGFCDTEMAKSKITRTKLSEDIDALSSAIESGKATVLELTESTAELQKELTLLGQGEAEAEKIRNEEKAKNEATIADAVAGQEAVAKATVILKDFYTKAAGATAFLQTDSRNEGVKMGSDEWKALANPDYTEPVDKGHKEGMKTFGEVNKGQQDLANGVLGMLEVIKSDFANLEADTKASEESASQAYENFLVESKKSRAMKNKKVELNEADRTAAEAKMQQDTMDLKSTKDEAAAAERYYKELEPQCLDQGMTFNERAAARKAEIDSLKDALEILRE